MSRLPSFHPILEEWFTNHLGDPTPAQVEGWESIRDRTHTLIAAPTGSGKTLAAFYTAIDELFTEGLAQGGLPSEVRVLYVSPLKALSTDINKNLVEPLSGIRTLAGQRGLDAPLIRTAVRSGDTPSSERAAMLRTPPHILVTTPESLFLLLTAQRSREMLRTVRTVIVDEIHAILDARRGPHLALSLERLAHVAHEPLLRIGLSATQKPIETVARYLVGSRGRGQAEMECRIVNKGHRRELDLALELPGSPLEAVMSHEVWEELYDRLATLISEHRTTIVFVNTRRLAERLARHLSDRLGQEAVSAHHGSLSKEKRLDAESRLKDGTLRALVATASLELGIDIGHVDLVCQIGSTRWISTFLQRVGRSGHTIAGTPKGRLFPITRDDLLECVAILRAVRRGDLDTLILDECPLDVLAQQTVAEAACEDWAVDALYDMWTQAYPFRDLKRDVFVRVVEMAARGYAGKRGRRGALLHHDGVNQRVRGRRGARMMAITAGGAIPDNADYRVILEPEQIPVGSVNEDFAIESIAGDVFQLGNASWRILQVVSGTVRVADAQGEPPNIPFWFGEAPARSDAVSTDVSDLRAELDARLDEPDTARQWLRDECDVPVHAIDQIIKYLVDARHLLGVLPSQQHLVLERFFDESGGMQLVLHAPFGSRVNRAWGLALRKKFCRQFNFELQAAATENAVLLSLGPQHSFPLDDVFRYLHPNTVRTTLIQAMLDAPMFQTRWRWNATLSLAVPRQRGGKKVPPQLQRMEAEDMLAAVFPDAAACLENIGGDREIPDHPLIRQSIEDCLTQVMDLDGLDRVLHEILKGSITCTSRDTPEPSVLAHEILNAMPYQFLDDAPLEERRTQAVYTRRAFEPSNANELGALDREAIARVADEAWPDPRNADELHDALLTGGFLTEVEGINARGESWMPLFTQLEQEGRARRVTVDASGRSMHVWVASERADELDALYNKDELALRTVLRDRMQIIGPTTVGVVAASIGLPDATVEAALVAIESEGNVLRGSFTPDASGTEWCDRRLLARIHRYTLNRLRSEIEPVPAADYMRFLFHWHHAEPDLRRSGVEGVAAVINQLEAFELAAGAWESDVLPNRISDYDRTLLDNLSLTGRVAWTRLTHPLRPGAGPNTNGPVRTTPVALVNRGRLPAWRALAGSTAVPELTSTARAVLDILDRDGAVFFHDIVEQVGLLATQVEQALGTLVAAGLVSSDSFAGLRSLIRPASTRGRVRTARRKHEDASGVAAAGRWAPIPRHGTDVLTDDVIEMQARTLLRRYGVVFRRVLFRETNLAPWRDIVQVYRRLEARGEIRGGRFVSGMSGEQFALPEAVGTLRKVRRSEKSERPVFVSACDPLNLTGSITPGDRIASLPRNRIAYVDGVPVAAREGDTIRTLAEFDEALEGDIKRGLQGRPAFGIRPGIVGRAG